MTRKLQPDVVFLDIGMLGVDGDGACRRTLEAGFDAQLTKPVDPSAVEDLLAVSAGARQTSVST